MARTSRLLLAAAVLAASAACGTSTTTYMSCSHGADYCYDFPSGTTVQAALTACVGVGGVGGQYVPEACTPLDLSGSCTGSANNLVIGTVIRYYYPAFDETRAAQACAMAGGAFSGP
ncbi:MAG TPA: hypothetical protein VMT17_05030 [Anaeromyxobacteraceae bacterium]|nr:hypothetical protein [Anaeromyxobacteraceae bacterium]